MLARRAFGLPAKVRRFASTSAAAAGATAPPVAKPNLSAVTAIEEKLVVQAHAGWSASALYHARPIGLPASDAASVTYDMMMRRRLIAVGDYGAGESPTFLAYDSAAAAAAKVLSLIQVFGSVHHILFPPRQITDDAEAGATPVCPRWNFVGDIDAEHDKAVSFAELARRVLSAINTCLTFQHANGVADQDVLLLRGTRTDRYSMHVYVFIKDEATSFRSPSDMALFAKEVNMCLGFAAFDFGVYHPMGSLRLPFAQKHTAAEQPPPASASSSEPLKSDDSEAAGIAPTFVSTKLVPWMPAPGSEVHQRYGRAFEWLADQSEADIVARCLQVGYDVDRAVADSHRCLSATTLTASQPRSWTAVQGEANDDTTVDPKAHAEFVDEALRLVANLPQIASEPYRDWQRVGFAIRVACVDNEEFTRRGYEAFDAFSARCPEKYNTRRVAKHFAQRFRLKLNPSVGPSMLRRMMRDYHAQGQMSAAALADLGISPAGQDRAAPPSGGSSTGVSAGGGTSAQAVSASSTNSGSNTTPSTATVKPSTFADASREAEEWTL